MDIARDKTDITAKIKKAMENHELKAYYQPQYDSVSNRLVSAEALVRWIKPDGTVVPPMEFIPELEKSTAIMDVDWYMLDEVCSLIKRMMEQNKPIVKISVNFSRIHFVSESDFTKKLCSIVDNYGLNHKLIEIEITESAFVYQSEALEKTIAEIRAQGFSTAIDDFGSGVSSLSFVKDVAVDVLKIDRSLLSHNCEDEKERIVLESIFHFAHRLKLDTIAEGVETKEQLSFLRTCNCKSIQGFLFSKPLPEEEFIKACETQTDKVSNHDILLSQSTAGATQLLLDAIFAKFPLVVLANLTRNSYYMMSYKNFTSTTCASTGIFDELISEAKYTIHPDDREKFSRVFKRENQLEAHNRGEKMIKAVVSQKGDDGVWRRVEITNCFVKNPSSDDVLIISLSHNIE